MKELKIGEEIRIRCVDADVEPWENCTKCCFRDFDCGPTLVGHCTSEYRTDGKNVLFEIVED